MILIIMISSVNIFTFHPPWQQDERGGGRGGGHTWPIPEAYVALNFGLLELSFP
jgi:hypothetical protein